MKNRIMRLGRHSHPDTKTCYYRNPNSIGSRDGAASASKKRGLIRFRTPSQVGFRAPTFYREYRLSTLTLRPSVRACVQAVRPTPARNGLWPWHCHCHSLESSALGYRTIFSIIFTAHHSIVQPGQFYYPKTSAFSAHSIYSSVRRQNWRFMRTPSAHKSCFQRPPYPQPA